MKHLIASLGLALAIGGGAACHGSKAATPKTPEAPTPVVVADGPSCDLVADHLRDEMVRVAAEDPTDISRLVPVFRRVVAERCVADAWSAEARTCLSTANGDDLNACEGKLTADQNTALGKAVDAGFNEELMQPGAGEEKEKSKSLAAPPGGGGGGDGADPCGGDE